MFQHNRDIYDSKPTSNPSANKVRIVSIEEVDFCTEFVGWVPGNKICGLMKGDNGSCNKYKTHADQEKGNVESDFYLTTNDTNLLLKPLVLLVICDANQSFLSHVVEYLSKDTYMAIMDKVNSTANTSTEVVEEAAYVQTIPTAVTETC